jgi:tripartite-type tricarboxylate transporter receptor subunit TctC
MSHGTRSGVNWVAWLAACVCSPCATASFAQSYPAKPVRLVVGFAPGGSTDLSARLLGQRLTEYMGQQVIVENRTGAGTAIANALVAKSPPDGYTLLLVTASAAGLSAVRKDLPYDLDRDFTPISRVATTTYVLMVHPSLPVKNVKDLVALARKHPWQLSHGSEGYGGSGHLCAELFKAMTKVDILHVPYKGGSESSVATASGEVAMAFPSLTAALPMFTAGRIKLLAVTSAKRSAFKPDIPTLAESGVPV